MTTARLQMTPPEMTRGCFNVQRVRINRVRAGAPTLTNQLRAVVSTRDAVNEATRLGHITGRGPALLRSLLVESAWMVWRLNDWAQHFVDKVSRGGRGRRKLAIVALAKKLLVLLWGMLKSNRPFHAPKARTPTAPATALAMT